MQLKFKGSAVYVYGAMRGNHGLYSAQLDGGNLVYQLGYSEEPKIQALLFSQGGLDPKNEHTVVSGSHCSIAEADSGQPAIADHSSGQRHCAMVV